MGDGIYIAVINPVKTDGKINIVNNVIENCRRNGISIIHGKNITIKNNTIRYTHGTWPQVGIDLERNLTEQVYENVLIESNSIYGNEAHYSIQIFPGIKGFLKIINNHLGDRVVAFDDSRHPELPVEKN